MCTRVLSSSKPDAMDNCSTMKRLLKLSSIAAQLDASLPGLSSKLSAIVTRVDAGNSDGDDDDTVMVSLMIENLTEHEIAVWGDVMVVALRAAHLTGALDDTHSDAFQTRAARYVGTISVDPVP